MRVIEAQCSWSWHLTITPHINQIRVRRRAERPNLRASTGDRRGVARRPERRIFARPRISANHRTLPGLVAAAAGTPNYLDPELYNGGSR
jgi:hypothetical protein